MKVSIQNSARTIKSRTTLSSSCITGTSARQWSFFSKPTIPAAKDPPDSAVQATVTTTATDAQVVTLKTGQHAGNGKGKGKTMAQLDEEIRLAMEGRAGDGGESGVELEDGKAVAMKRGVRDNMFRYI